MKAALFVFQTMVLVHLVDGQEVAVNAEYVTRVSEPNSQQHDKSKCMIYFVNGHFVNTKETCDEVRAAWQREDAKVK